ncbi:cyclic nucleotide-binding domain-containing protein [Legionella quinlivanii]|uniref:cyclic nucleotide-binding domain-containing protein n=1 Tax=Legionella quinlivanii TaxID=45073 RepID=UPI0022435E1B|nr:cyclic nucleotide-binding domain-containing protein [Legionella quinlivanii]MCW8450525.1 popeye domain-containing protein [Legionella quinlivanii]
MDLTYHIAELLLLVSYLLRDMLHLRIVACFVSLLYIFYGMNHNLPEIYWWSVIYLVVNIFQILLIFKQKLPAQLDPPLQAIKDQLFTHMVTSEFVKLIKLSKEGEARTAALMSRDQPVSRVLLLTEGKALVYCDKHIIELKPYHFLGEMSFFNNQLATADVIVKEPVKFIYWEYETLKRLQERQPGLFIFMLEAIGKDMVLKLMNTPGLAEVRH